MILAAGYGTRLRPLTETTPKPLLPVGGIPLIVWNLMLLRHYGIMDVVINLHHLGHLIENELGDGSRLNMRISYSHEKTIMGTGGGIKQVESFFEGQSFLVLNGDTLFELNLTELIDSYRGSGGLATMVLRDDPEVEKWGVVETTVSGQVIRINGRGRSLSHGGASVLRHMFSGAHIIHPRLLQHCPKDRPSSIIDAYVAELQQGSEINGFLAAGYWSDIGTPERYAQAQCDADDGRISCCL